MAAYLARQQSAVYLVCQCYIHKKARYFKFMTHCHKKMNLLTPSAVALELDDELLMQLSVIARDYLGYITLKNDQE